MDAAVAWSIMAAVGDGWVITALALAGRLTVSVQTNVSSTGSNPPLTSLMLSLSQPVNHDDDDDVDMLLMLLVVV